MKSFLLLILLLISQQSFAAESNWKELVASDLVSPVTTPARYILIGGSIASAVAFFNQSRNPYKKRESFKDAQPIGNFGFLGEYLGYGPLNLGYIAWASWYGHHYQSETMLKNAEIMARASLYSSSLTLALKSTISERRPGYPDDNHSFPSGHSSASFSFASVIAARHGWYYGSVAYALAGFIAVSRVNDDFHYLHDILAGITIGASYGWGVHYNATSTNGFIFGLMPMPDRGMGAMLGFNF